ncbi:MAG: alpha/beta family hydrolase [Thermoanaerobaculia bacterium]
MQSLTDGPENARHVFLFAHGAGAPMDHAWMNTVAEGMGAQGIRVVRFEFPYRAARRAAGKKGGAPDRQPVLLDTWRRVIEEHGGGGKVCIGGKSMGGRMASMVADEMGVRGLICFGYPFHPPGKPDQLRIAHLEHLSTPALLLQGTRDPFGTREDVATYPLSKSVRVEWIERGDHSLNDGLPRVIASAALFNTEH